MWDCDYEQLAPLTNGVQADLAGVQRASVENCCRPFGAWENIGLLTRGRRSYVALTPGYML